MEDWQQWQIRADQIAAELGRELDALTADFFSGAGDVSYRGFWPRFRDMKERVRTAPAIRLEDKLSLERRLRQLGARAYKGQEALIAQSQERREQILSSIQAVRSSAESTQSPRELRSLRRDLDRIRGGFESESPLMPPDRQALWDAWRIASQYVWERLTAIWAENEAHVRGIVATARQQLEASNSNAARQTVVKLFETMKSRELRQSVAGELRAEAAEIRDEASKVGTRREAEHVASSAAQTVSPLETWQHELTRNREAAARLLEDVDALEEQIRSTSSLLEQAMLRGTLVEKRRKLGELERGNRTLEQRIDQATDTSLIPAG